jgi:cytochrome c
MARYVGHASPSAETLKTHFTKVWRLRKGATFAPIKPKWFIVTMNSEGDYDFVVNGGPWTHLGDAFLVQPLKGSE